jgi:hypothetical protein
MKKFFKSLLSANGEISSKRSIGLSAAITIIFASIVDLFSNFTITDYVFEGLVWLAIYLSAWVVMRLLFPRWRFRGGEWIGKWPRIS